MATPERPIFPKVKKTYRLPAALLEVMDEVSLEKMMSETALMVEMARFYLRTFYPTKYGQMIGKETSDEAKQ